MALREIITVGDPRLREHAHPVTRITPELRRLVDDMVETMHAADGIGLAGPQIAESVRVVVIQLPEDEEVWGSGELYAVFNPEIVKASRDTEEGIEGCLSIPGYVGEVERATEVVVRGVDVNGKRFRLRPRGFLARVFQHEIDHLDGILYIDRLTAPDKVWEVKPGTEETTEAEHAGEGSLKEISLPA